MKVLVLNASALHLGFLGCYGNEWIETPQLDRLAAESIVFDQHYADNPGDIGEEQSCWTGRYRFPYPQSEGSKMGTRHPGLGRLLEEREISVARVQAASSAEGLATASWKSIADKTLRELNRLESQDQWLLWVDLSTLAPPWQIPGEFLSRYFAEGTDEEDQPLLPWLDPSVGLLDLADAQALERLQNTYGAVVTHFDSRLGLLLDQLEERGLRDEALVCVTAGSGLSLGEHGIVGPCRPWLHEEMLHLPLMVRLPQGAEAGRRVLGLTQPVDLPPTLLEAFDLPAPTWAHGHSLWSLMRGQKEQVRVYACAGMQTGETIEWALRTPRWGSMLPVYFAADDAPRQPQLYLKPDDRWEVNNVRQHHLDLAEHLEQTLRGFVEASRRPEPLQPPELPEHGAEQLK
jgi:arylsulfatase A-like enzyme